MKTFLFKTSLCTILFLMLASFFRGTPTVVQAAPKPSNTPKATPTSKPTKTVRPTNTPKFTSTPSATFTATQTATPTNTPTAMPTFTDTPTSTSTPTSIPANLLAYWKFDEGSGNTVADSSGNGHTLTLERFPGSPWTDFTAPTLFANPFALKFFSLDYPKYGIPVDTIDLANKSFSVGLWVARSDMGYQSTFFGQDCFSSDCLKTDQLLSLGFSPSNNFVCGFYNDDLVTSATSSDGNWHHYVCSYDAVNHVRKAYKDGVLVGSDQPLGNYVGTQRFMIGYGPTGQFAGLVDEARIYDAPLGEAQVAALAERDPAYTPAPCTPHALLQPAGGAKIPQLLQLYAIVDNGCEAAPGTDPFSFNPDPFTFTWRCQSDTSVECPNFLASANTAPHGNWMPVLNLQEFDVIQVWVQICLVDNPLICSTADRIYEGAAVN